MLKYHGLKNVSLCLAKVQLNMFYSILEEDISSSLGKSQSKVIFICKDTEHLYHSLCTFCMYIIMKRD